MTDIKEMKKGTLFILSSGQYSDYSVHAIGRLLEDINVLAVKERFIKEKDLIEKFDGWSNYKPRVKSKDDNFLYDVQDEFILWFLNESGLAEELKYGAIHVGDYSELDVEIHKSPEGGYVDESDR